MVDSKISSKPSMKTNSLMPSRKRKSTTSIDSLMTWSLKSSRETEVSSGPAKTTTVMSRVTLSPKVTVPSVSWHQSSSTPMMSLKLKPLTELSQDIIDNGKREKEPQLTQLPQSSPGLEVSLTEQNSIIMKLCWSSHMLWKKPPFKPLKKVKWPRIWLY